LKIVLSRKGFDSSSGGHASPILPDGRMVSLPIPSPLDRVSWHSLRLPDGTTYARLIEELDAGARLGGAGAHVDPDLVRSIRPRRRGWRPAFGQVGAAAGHLRLQGVGENDLFLFFGWFRHAVREQERLRFAPGSGFHAIFGYLRVGTVIDAVPDIRLPAWLEDHPHAAPARCVAANNTLYVARRELEHGTGLPGAGVFRFADSLVLSCPGRSRSRWQLDPAVFRHLKISYHDESAWQDGCFQSRSRAQEYVIDADRNAQRWALALVRAAHRWA
jgi:hypothetical protein